MARAQGLREQKKVATWRSINAAATRLFLDRGYEAVSIEEIAAAARVSPSTFFNYFTTKEAVVFDPDPEDATTIRGLLAARPSGEAMWTSLSEVLIGYVVTVGPRAVIQKRLKSASPALAACGRALGDRIREGLEAWGAERHPGMSRLESSLLVNLAVTALLTAYEAWDPDTGVAALTATVRDCLDRTGKGVAPLLEASPRYWRLSNIRDTQSVQAWDVSDPGLGLVQFRGEGSLAGTAPGRP